MERPILMTIDSVKAILDGRKTMTRRAIKPQPFLGDKFQNYEPQVGRCPYGQVGDRLWVRETWAENYKGQILYRADYKDMIDLLELPAMNIKWKPSIHMFRKDSRLTLEITGVRVERLQEITYEDCFAEGVKFSIKMKEPTAIFKDLWDSINGKKYPWSSNPWCWVLSFRRIS